MMQTKSPNGSVPFGLFHAARCSLSSYIPQRIESQDPGSVPGSPGHPATDDRNWGRRQSHAARRIRLIFRPDLPRWNTGRICR